MNVGAWVLVSALLVIFTLSLFFIFCRRYEEGIINHGALWGLVIACGVLLWDVRVGDFEVPQPAVCLAILCMAWFMGRHAYRFAMFHWHGWFGWKPPADRRVDA